LIADANKIYYQFIDDKATNPINIPGDVKEKIQRIWKDEYNFPKDVNQWVFNEAHASIFKLMYSDSFRRYAQTEEGKRMIALHGHIDTKENNTKEKDTDKEKEKGKVKDADKEKEKDTDKPKDKGKGKDTSKVKSNSK
jgi:hypothetical protein